MVSIASGLNRNFCSSYQCLEKYDGKIFWVQGNYLHPQPKTIEPTRLQLADGTIIVLSKLEGEKMARKLDKTNNGVLMKVKGQIFTDKIPDKYKIIARTPDPYLVDIQEIQIQ